MENKSPTQVAGSDADLRGGAWPGSVTKTQDDIIHNSELRPTNTQSMSNIESLQSCNYPSNTQPPQLKTSWTLFKQTMEFPKVIGSPALMKQQ